MPTALTTALAHLAADAVPDILWIVDNQGLCHYYNQTGAEFFGCTPEDLIGTLLARNPHMAGKFPQRIVELREEVIRSGEKRQMRQVAIRDANNQTQFMDVSLQPLALEVDGLPRDGMLGIGRRVTDLVALESRVSTDRNLLDTIVRNAPVIVWATDAQGVFTVHTGLGLRALGLAAGELCGQSAYRTFKKDPDVIAGLDRVLGGKSAQWVSEFNQLWHETTATPLFDSQGKPAGATGVSTDITERRRAELRLTDLAYQDPVTQLPNRTRLVEWLEALINHASAPHTLACMDIDHFSRINDSFGRAMGDQVLRAAAARLTKLLPEARLAHIGGDHFAFLLPTGKAEDAQAAVERVLLGFADALVLDSGKFYCNASAGLAVQPRELTADQWLGQAELAVERAKREGRNRCSIYSDRLIEGVQADTRLYLELRHAIDHGLLEVRYEPQVRISDRRIAGFEALTRWRHPPLENAPVDRTIRIAEESGLIRDITRLVLGQVTRDLMEWKQRLGNKLPRVAININASDFVSPDFMDLVDRAIDVGLPADALRVELTESAMMENPDTARATLRALRSRGIHASLDDFGTGHSSLSLLHDLPVDELKIDKAFMPVQLGPNTLSVLRTIMALAGVLRLRTIVEGVEAEAQHQLLAGLGCDYAQGFLYSRALNARTACDLYAAGNPL